MPKYQPSKFTLPERDEIERIARTSASGTSGTGPGGPPTAHHATHQPGGSDALRLTTDHRLFGRATAGAGALEELTIGDNLLLTGTTLSATTRSSNLINYSYSAATTEPPAADQVRFNAGFPYTAVTKVWARNVSADGQDVYLGLLQIPIGSTVLVQDKNDHTQYAVFTTTANVIDKSPYVEMPVAWKANGGSLGGGQIVILQNISGASGFTQLTGDVTAGPGSGSQVATIAANAVTYAKLQDVSAASRLLGRGSASGSGDPEEIVLGTNLSMSGTTLNASGGGGAAHATTHNTGGSDPITALAGSVITTGTIASARLPARVGAVGIVIDGGGSVLTTGVKGFVSVPFACTITGWTLLSTDGAATAGSIVMDVWKDTYANYPPTVADTITASAKPTLSAANKSENTTLTGWTTAIAAGDVLGFSVDSVSTVSRVTLLLTVQAS